MMTFRKATLFDVQEINTLVNSAYRGESSKAGWTTEEHLLGGQRTDVQALEEMMRNDHIELAVEDAQILGCIYLRKEMDTLYFGMLTVRPTLQNRGIGKHLLQKVEDLAKEWGLKKIRMTVISSRKELIEYYERRGYHWTGKTEPFPETDPRFGIPKTKLVFKVFEKILVSD